MNKYHITAFMTTCIVLSACVSDGKSISKKAGEAVGESVTEFGKGVGAKVDESANIPLELDQLLIEMGISKSVAKTNWFDSKAKGEVGLGKGALIYLMSKNEVPVKQYRLIALDQGGMEIGRSKVEISFVKDDGKYVEFPFDSRTDLALIRQFRLTVSQ